MTTVFISYRRKDSAHASGRIYDMLVDTFGKDNVLMDIDNIRSGYDFREEIPRLLAKCNVVLAIIGPQWLGEDPATNTRRIDDPTDPVRVEIEHVISKNTPIIPLLIDGMTMEQLVNLPETMATMVYRNGFVIHSGSSFRADVEMIIRRIKADYPDEADLQQQQVQERLAQLEREKKVREDRVRIAQLEAEHQQQIERDRLAAIAAEEERQRREAQAAKEKHDAEVKEKQAVILKQKDNLRIPLMALSAIIMAVVGGFIGHSIWLNNFHDFGGGFVNIFMILLIGFIGAIIGFYSGILIGIGISESVAPAILTTAGIVIGGIFGAVKGSGGSTLGLIFGVLIGIHVGGFVLGAISAMFFQDADTSAWYINGSSRISLKH